MAYRVRIANTDYQFIVEAGERVLSAARRQHIPLPWGCDSGVCGTCMGTVMEGLMTYPAGEPLALFEDDAAAGKGLFCCGVAQSDLLLYIPELS